MRRSTGVAAAVTAIVLVLGGCGSGSDSDSHGMDVVTGVKAERLIAASADKADSAGTARMAGSVSVKTPLLPSGTDMEMNGVVDFRSGALQFNVDFAGLIPNAPAGLEMQLRVVDGVTYMGFGGLDEEARRELEPMFGDKQWIKMDPASLGLDQEALSGSGDPGTSMDALRGIEGARPIGTETIRGVDTTHYRGTIDTSKAKDLVPEDEDLGILEDMLDAGWTVDVWIDADGQTRKMRMEVDSPGMSLVEVFEFYDFGTPVDLSAPPADEVLDYGEFLQSFGNLGLEPAA